MQTQSIHLQEIGQFTAKPASDFKVGDVTVWNGGSTAEVVSVEVKGRSVFMVLKTAEKTWPIRRFLATRLIACTGIGGKTRYL